MRPIEGDLGQKCSSTCLCDLYRTLNLGKIRAIETQLMKNTFKHIMRAKMVSKNQRAKTERKNKIRIIAVEIATLWQKCTYDYIEAMTSELSTMAAGSDQQLLGYLLGLASAEAKACKSRQSLVIE